MNILVLNKNILAIDPQFVNDSWVTEDQIIPMHVAEGAALITVTTLPNDYISGKYQYDNGFVPVIVPMPIPKSISPRQIRQALTRVGLRNAVELAVSSGDQDTKDWWEFSTEFLRDHSEVLKVQQGLGKTDDEVDSIWKLAGTL